MDMTLSVRAYLESLIADRGETYANISLLIGRNPAYIQQFIKRGTPRKLDENDRRILARYFGVTEQALGQVERSAVARPLIEPAVVQVPRLALGASAGDGALETDERVTGVMAFDASWLRHLGVRPQRVAIIRVDGESMTPTLGDGDDIMVDHDDDAGRLRDGVYVLRLDGVLMVKRIALGPLRGRLSVLSDNVCYPNWADIDPTLVEIVGRVVWYGRRMK